MALRIDFYNEIAHLLCYPEKDSLDLELTDEEIVAIRHMLDALGRLYYAPPCSQMVSTTFQDQLARELDPSLPEHEDCPCVRSEEHTTFHRCKHGYFSK